ncbi:DUF6680 family protein [Bradyrhizobium japonicum]|uniref:DUF6680 family protein n=1 Tax=Bradyrhizobium japonicum TaxID=375 RepID=UPI0027149101|nr:DUF6680 family protein [Bradyrhizobium japonicum]WLB58046.1 hypothetical protein QIH94_19270 [Bradyrhizobium japonicum]WLB60086.1 hypothetical protein QIH96_26665 [Bradyrhizobium japonicum]
MAIEWWVVLATLLGPVVAVQTQKWIERASERGRRRQWIFTALMANRATRLSDEYVRALNLIDLEFSPKRFGGAADRRVINAWRALFGELGNAPSDDNQDLNLARAWNERVTERLVDLLSEMSTALGYTFSEEELRRGIYYPKGRVDLEQSQIAIMHGLSKIVQGTASLPMKITEIPASPEAAKLQATLNEKMIGAYHEDGSLKVRVQNT